MWNCLVSIVLNGLKLLRKSEVLRCGTTGITLLTALKVVEGGSSRTTKELIMYIALKITEVDGGNILV